MVLLNQSKFGLIMPQASKNVILSSNFGITFSKPLTLSSPKLYNYWYLRPQFLGAFDLYLVISNAGSTGGAGGCHPPGEILHYWAPPGTSASPWKNLLPEPEKISEIVAIFKF